MHAVMRRSIEDRLDRLGQTIDRLGVNPVLVQQVELPGFGDMVGRNAEQWHWKEHPSCQESRPRLTEGGRQVVTLTRVMADVVGPEEPYFVHPPVIPVVEEIPGDHRDRKRPSSCTEVDDAVSEDELPERADCSCQGKVHRHVANQHRQAGLGITTFVADRNERVGREPGIGQFLFGGVVEVAEFSQLALFQHLVLPDHRSHEQRE